MGGEDNAFLPEESKLWFREALESDDFSESFIGGVGRGGEKRHRFIEFFCEGGLGIVLRGGYREVV